MRQQRRSLSWLRVAEELELGEEQQRELVLGGEQQRELVQRQLGGELQLELLEQSRHRSL
jgi:hypothetical protein